MTKLPHPIEALNPRSLNRLTHYLQSLVEGRLWLKVLIGMALGLGAGLLISPNAGLLSEPASSTLASWLGLPGQIFLAAIQMIVVPLVFASIIRGLAASENMEQLRRLGTQAMIFFVVTTTIAIVIGLTLASVVNPGRFVNAEAAAPSATSSGPLSTQPEGADSRSLPEAIVGLIPQNPLASMANSEMLGVVLFALIVGIALVSLPPDQSQPLLSLLGSLQQVSMAIVSWAMLLAPVAVFGLMAQLTAQIGLDALLGLSVYVVTVLAGLLVLIVLYVLLAAVAGGKKPGAFLASMRELQLLAFSTSSSAAVMPLSIQTAEEKLGVRPSVSQFVIPLGATVNMNGTALYQGVATVFLAQVFSIELTLGQLALVVVTSVAASIGSPATPGVGIVILSMVLSTAGIPAAGLALILGVDRILDMSRTAVNVTGDVVAAVVLDRSLDR